VAALRNGRTGRAYNLSGWRAVELREALGMLAGGELPAVCNLPSPTSEARVTHGCGRRAAAELGYSPRVELAEGLERQLALVSPGRLAA